MRKKENIEEIKSLLKDVFEMSWIEERIGDMMKEECKKEDDIEHCAYLIHLKNEVKKVLKK